MAAKKTKQISNIKKKQIDFLVVLKALTKWITNNKRTDTQLEDIIERYEIENNVVKRILSYNYGFPYIIHYFNKYLNHKFDFDSYDTKTLIKSIIYLMDINNRNNFKMFMFFKATDLKDEIKNVIKNLIKEYLSITYNIECNNRELNFYYRLFKSGVIQDEDLLEIDRLLNGDKTVIKSLSFINYKDAINFGENGDDVIDKPIEEIIQKEMSTEVIEFINSIKNEKINRETCRSCPLYKKPIVILDTNSEKVGDPIDIVFIGLNPGQDEVKQDKPFVGDSGKYIRRIIDKLPKDKKWLIFNIILCNTSNKKEIGDVNNIIRNCMDLTKKIFINFPSKIFIPIGDDAKSIFGITDTITNVSGKIIKKDNDIIVVPLIHPSSILRNAKYQSIFDAGVKNILSLFNIIEETPIKSKQVELAQDDKDLLLVDIKKIENNKLLMIYTDIDGNKKYITKDYSFPVLIKNKKWNECGMTTDKTDDTCYMNDYQKSLLNKKCREILSNMVAI